MLTNILVNPSRADGRSIAPTYEINYTTTQEVNVEASILAMNGKLVAQVSPTRAATVGENRLVWNGRDSKGQTLTAGTYLLQIRALTPEGELTRQTRPFIVTGR